MPAACAGVVAVWLLAAPWLAQARAPSPQAPPPASPRTGGVPNPGIPTSRLQTPGVPPHLLNMALVKLRKGAAGSYGLLEASIVRAYERAKVKVYWVALQAPKDANEVLYLNLYDSPEAAERTSVLCREALKQHPELVKMQHRLDELVASQTSMLTTRRDDVDPVLGRPDFAMMRALRLTIFHVRPGREGNFIMAIRTAAAKDRSWLVYEANETSTFALITPMRTPRSDRRDGPPIPRALQRFKGVVTRADTRVYAVRPAMSHVSQSFAAANPQLWRPVPTALHE